MIRPSSRVDGSTPNSADRASPADSRWQLEDLIDFEYFVETDRHLDALALEARDRDIYRARIAPHLPSAEDPLVVDRRWVFKQWLAERRRHRSTDQPWPGDLYRSARRVLTRGLAAAGVVVGAGAAAHLLRYDGVQPVNVAAYLGWLVLLQIVLVLLAAGVALLRRLRFLSSEAALLTRLARWAWTALAARLIQQTADRIPGERRTQLAAFLGSTAAKRSLFGHLPVWPLVGLLQLFGVCFNAGVIVTTLGLVVFSDRAFGWQSAADVTATQVHRLTQALALPWSWLLPEGTGAPTLAQIDGSRIILKDGIRQLATENLVSWWPFLCLATLTYGLLPRAALGLVSWALGRRALRTVPFDYAACDRLYERLSSARLQTRGEGAQPDREPWGEEPIEPASLAGAGEATSVPANGAVVLLEPELLGALGEDKLRQVVADRLHCDVFSCHAAGLNPSDLRDSLATLTRRHWSDRRPKLVVVQEAWQPPIAETLNALRLLRKTFGDAAKLQVALVGRPAGTNVLTPVKASDWTIWERQLAALGDPLLRLEALVSHA